MDQWHCMEEQLTLKPVGWKEIYKYLDISSITTDADCEILILKTPINSKKPLGV